MKISLLSKIGVSIALITVLLASCKKDTYNQLTDEEMSTWGIYKADQKFNFISTQGELRPYSTGGLYSSTVYAL